MNVKVTFFFEGVQQARKYASATLGWTETFYGTSTGFSTLDQWLNATDVNNYIQLRRATLPSTYRIAWVRVSDEGNVRSFKIRAINAGFGNSVEVTPTPAQIGPPTIEGQVQCALLVDLVRLPGSGPPPESLTHHRRFLMRALPVDVINGNVVNNVGPNWRAIKVFLNWLAKHETGETAPFVLAPLPNSTLGIRYQLESSPGWATLGAVALAPGDPRSIVIANDVGVNAKQVRIRRCPDNARDLNRTWKVQSRTSVPTASSVLGRAKRDLQNGVYSGTGAAQYLVVTPFYALFDQYTIIGLRTKKTGRLFRQLRGRASTR